MSELRSKVARTHPVSGRAVINVLGDGPAVSAIQTRATSCKNRE